MSKSPTTSPETQDDILAGEYVLGVMPHSERSAFAQRLLREPDLLGIVHMWERRFAPLTDTIEPVAAPSTVWNGLESRLFPAPAASQPNWWNSLLLWRGLATGALAAALAFGAVLVIQPAKKSGDLVAQVAGDSEVKLVVLYDPDTATLRLNRTAGAAAQGRVFELWLIAGKDAPVSLGVLPGANTQRVVVPEPMRAKLQNAVLAISDEPTGGSPTGQPTGAVLATGALTMI
jgi:anti-sigma-K factor RskA